MIWIIGIVSLLIAVLPLIVLGIAYEDFFRKGFITDARFLYTQEDFPKLKRKSYIFPSDRGHSLKGYLYYKEDNSPAKALIVLAHGLGSGGHVIYTPEINYFTDEGYQVFTYDATGNDENKGKGVRGMLQGVIDLDHALRFVENEKSLRAMPVLLYGHSWGGYTVMSVLNAGHKVAAVVNHAGFNATSRHIVVRFLQMKGKLGTLFEFYIKLYEKIKFGSYAGWTALDGLKKTTAKVLLMHSKDDPWVSYDINFKMYQEALGANANYQFITFEDRAHDVLRTQSVQKEME